MGLAELFGSGIVGFGDGIVLVRSPVARRVVASILREGFERVEVVGEDITIPIARHWELRSAQGNRTSRWRPVPASVSIGHIDITAGTLGWFATYNRRPVMVSNAHVFHPNPSSNAPPQRLEIVQPGSYDGGTLADTVGYYHSHVPIRCVSLSNCPVSGLIGKLLNALSELLGRRTRFVALDMQTNDADIALASISTGYTAELVDNDGYLTPPKGRLAGFLFAGGGDFYVAVPVSTVEGYYPGISWKVETASVSVGDKVVKCGRTTGCTEGTVESTNFTVRVTGYPCGDAIFTNTILVRGQSAGGDSGSAVWVVK